MNATTAAPRRIYVSPFPGPGGRVLVTTPLLPIQRWRGDGKEIYILSINTGYLVAVPVSE